MQLNQVLRTAKNDDHVYRNRNSGDCWIGASDEIERLQERWNGDNNEYGVDGYSTEEINAVEYLGTVAQIRAGSAGR